MDRRGGVNQSSHLDQIAPKPEYPVDSISRGEEYMWQH